MVSMVTPDHNLCTSSFSFLNPGKRSEKQGQSFTKHAINSLARLDERHYCDVS